MEGTEWWWCQQWVRFCYSSYSEASLIADVDCSDKDPGHTVVGFHGIWRVPLSVSLLSGSLLFSLRPSTRPCQWGCFRGPRFGSGRYLAILLNKGRSYPLHWVPILRQQLAIRM